MLTRAARQQTRQRLRQSILLAEYNQLALPFLCPAVSRCIRPPRRSSSATTRAHPSRPRSRSPHPRTEPTPQTRRLATATDSYHPGGSDDAIPFEGLSPSLDGKSSWRPYRPETNSLSGLSKFDTSQIILVPEKPHAQPLTFKSHSGISGNVVDLQQNLYACVQIGRLDRAAAITKHMTWLLDPTLPQVYDAHLRYFSGLLESLLHTPSEKTLTQMQKWIELEVREKGVPIDSRIIVVMLKATLTTLSGPRLDRTLRRYLGYAQQLGPAALDDTVTADIFTRNEWKKILQMCSREYKAPTDLITEPENEELEIAPRETTTQTFDQGLRGSQTLSESLPELRPVNLKGLGLEALRNSLQSLNIQKNFPSDGLDTTDRRFEQQVQLEQNVLDSALQRWHEESMITQEMRAKGQLSNPKLGSHVHDWVQAMAKLVKEKISEAEAMESTAGAHADIVDTLLVAPFLKMLNPEKACAATILSFLETLLQNKVMQTRVKHNSIMDTAEEHTPVRVLVANIGTEVVREAKAEEVEHHFLQRLSTMKSETRRRQLAQLVKKQRPSRKDEERMAQDGQESNDTWAISSSLRHKIGAEMLSMMIKVAELPVQVCNEETGRTTTEMQKIAEHSNEWRQGKKLGVVKTHSELVSRLKVEPVSSFIAKHLPMLCPPKPWTGLKQGGYLTTQAGFVRLRDSSAASEAYWKIADSRGDLRQSFAAVDVISKVPWRVHGELLKIMSQVWNTGEGMAKFAPENPDQEFPPEPRREDWVAHRQWKSLVRQIENESTSHHSQRCYQNFQLEVARSFVGKDFWTPHNIDFRGRAYPIPPYFNHIGSDYVRALFTFAEGKELGEEGLFWLKVHTANVFGFDKESLPDREAFVESHLPEIYDSAVRPMDGDRWWLKAEYPWQCLAACMEVKAALDSAVPSKFVSHLPIQQDGSCNGLQHYAALGGDEVGAKQVNLAPGDRPADIYSAVADLVKAAVAADAEKGLKFATILNGRLTRKCVKQPVMTNVYGVTFRGATQQVRKKLEDVLPKAVLDENITQLDALASYVARLIFKALAQMFNGAHAIQQWLGECGGRISLAVTPEQIERLKHRERAPGKDALISKSKLYARNTDRSKEDYQFKSTIVWTTPLGLPVVQPYRDAGKQNIETTLQKISIQLTTLSDPVSKRKQLQAFPPNFIHSLDASHMFLSALKCDEIGLTFASVHDSFWTHACNVPTMNRVLRDAFVRMHSEDIIGRLREEFIARYKGCFYRASVSTTSAVGKKIYMHVKKSRRLLRHHSQAAVKHESQIDDLFNEQERVRLMQSDDAEERARGEAMVTPASIFEDEGGEDNALVPEDVAMLGQTPENAESLARYAMSEVAGIDDLEAVTTPDEIDETLEIAPAEDDESAVEPREGIADTNQAIRKEEETKGSKKRPRGLQKVHFWRPLTFPPAPERGTFDVTRLKDSKYFFS